MFNPQFMRYVLDAECSPGVLVLSRRVFEMMKEEGSLIVFTPPPDGSQMEPWRFGRHPVVVSNVDCSYFIYEPMPGQPLIKVMTQ